MTSTVTNNTRASQDTLQTDVMYTICPMTSGIGIFVSLSLESFVVGLVVAESIKINITFAHACMKAIAHVSYIYIYIYIYICIKIEACHK